MSGHVQLQNNFTFRNLDILDDLSSLAKIPSETQVNVALPKEKEVFAYGANFVCREVRLPKEYVNVAVGEVLDIFIRFFPGEVFNEMSKLAEGKFPDAKLDPDKKVFASYNIESQAEYKYAVIDVAIDSQENLKFMDVNITLTIETLRELLCTLEHELAHSQGCDEYLARRRELEVAKACGHIDEVESILESIKTVIRTYSGINPTASLSEFEKEASSKECQAFYLSPPEIGALALPDLIDPDNSE